MSDPSRKEHVPTRDKLEREARRLARSRHLTVVQDEPTPLRAATTLRVHEPDPDPKAAA